MRSVVENSSEIVTVVDPDGTLRYANPAWERALGYDLGRAVGAMNVLDHVHPDDLAHVLEETGKALAKRGVATNEAEYRFRHADGTWRWMESVGTYLLDDPAVRGVVVTSRDVTERKEAEAALRSSEAEIFSVLESISDGFFALDHELRFTYVNHRAEVLLNRTREDLVGERLWEDPTFYPQYQRALTEGRTVRFEGYYPRLGQWYDVRAYPSGSGLSVYFLDVTARKKAEERLRFQARLLKAVGESVISLDVQGRVVYWNETAEKMYGWSSEEVMGRRLREMVVPEGLRGRAEGIMAEVREGKTWTGEFEVRHKDGTTFWVEGTDTPVFGDDGALIGVIGVLRDVTERKEVEEALRRNERYFRTLVQDASDLLTVLEADGTIRYVSHAVEKVIGYRSEEQVGTNAFDSVHPEDRQRALDLFAEILKTPGVHRTIDFRVPRWDGSWCYLEHVVNNLLDDASVEGIVVTSRDVTERKRSEEALRKSERRLRRAEQRYRRLVEQVPAVVYVQEIGSPDSATYMSPRIEDLTGYTPEECKDPDLRWRMVHPEDRERMRAEDARAGEPGEVFASEYRVLHRDGRVVWVRNESVLLEDEPGGTRYWQGFMIDITERKEAEEAIERLAHRNELILDSAGEGIYGLDREGRTTFVNPAAAALTGFDPEELIGKDQHEVIHHSRPDGSPYPREECPIHATLASGRVREEEEVFWRKDGTSFSVEYTSTPILEAGEVVGTVVTFTDATERRRAEEVLRESERRFRALTQNSSDVITLMSATGVIRYQSPSIERVLGYRPEETFGDSVFDYVHPDDLERVELAFAEGLEDPAQRPSVEYRIRRKNGTWVWLESVGTNLLNDPEVDGYVVNSRDVTERRLAEENLAHQAALLEQTHDAVFTRELDGKIVYWNEGAQRLYGWSKEEALGRISHDLLGTSHPISIEELVRTLRRDKHWEGELVHHARDGRRVVVLSKQVMARYEGASESVLETNKDITDHKILEDRLQHQASHDLLTGLPNRHLFMDRLNQALERTRRRKDRRVAVLFMDLDGFKVINDSLGHEVGDLLLTVVAQRLDRCLRPEDSLARFGGDEFVAFLEDVEGPDDAARLAKRISNEFRRPFVVDGRELFVAASIGIALGNVREKDSKDLLRDADTAMYRAKESGAGYAVFDPAMYVRVLGRLELENDLRHAIERDKFVVHYQPIIRLGDGATVAVEALVRWDHPERGLLSPDEFMPVAEESGLVIPMGEGVLREACLRAEGWQEEHPLASPLVVSVNLSAKQLVRPDFSETVARVLQQTGLEAGTLALDITESVYARTIEENGGSLDYLRGRGVRISIDDFGTGYSSLSYLKHLPADIIKIDKSFVEGLGEKAEDTAIVRMIIELTHTLGKEVIAEGVESEQQAKLLREMGCDMAQGFYLSKPLPPEAMSTFLTAAYRRVASRDGIDSIFESP